jgi:hypothetical protein
MVYVFESNPGYSKGAYRNVAAIKNDVLVCKKNEPAHHFAESMDYPCAIPPSWKTCVTAIKAGKLDTEQTSSGFIVKGTTFPGYPWILGAPENDEGDYCWQPVIEIYQLEFWTSTTHLLNHTFSNGSNPGMGSCRSNEEGCYRYSYIEKGGYWAK